MAYLSLEDRFWAKVDIRGEDECWPWLGSRDAEPKNYGRFWPHLRAHRVAFELAHGSIDPDLLVLHSCDNPPCCNPKHLSQGTNADNMVDMYRKNRFPVVRGRGEKANARTKLTQAKADDIRLRAARGETATVLADEFGVARATVEAVIKGVTWQTPTVKRIARTRASPS